MYPLQLSRPHDKVPISPVVWSLGFTSLFTDLSAEMVTSALPAFLVLHLHISPFAYGVIDGIQNGLAAALLGVAAALLVDRTVRHKQVALAGYGISAVSKLLLLLLSGAWGWMLVVVGLDRVGKGIRTAPRDALISLCTPGRFLASAFAVHRALDAAGALLGPLLAFTVLWFLPGGFEVIWFASLVAAILGLAVLWLYVPDRAPVETPRETNRAQSWLQPLRALRLSGLGGCAFLLSLLTISDAFIYLLLHQRGNTPVGLFPLFFVGTACAYMLWAIPLGRIADRIGRPRVFFFGYGVVVLLYTILLGFDHVSPLAQAGCVALLGLYYASTEGTLMAMASAASPAEARTTGIAVVAASVGLGKVFASVLFGWLWSTFGDTIAVSVYLAALTAAAPVIALWLRKRTLLRQSYA